MAKDVELQIDLGTAINEETVVHSNIGQEIIITTADKTKLVLVDTLKKLGKRNKWLTPLGIFLSLLLAICTAEFKQLWLSPDQWFVVFFMLLIGSVVWLIVTLIQLVKASKINIESVIEQLKIKTQ